MKSKLDEVRDLGAATAEEWFKGLEVDAKERAAETARWEHWELSGGFQSISRKIAELKIPRRHDHETNRQYPSVSEMDCSSDLDTTKSMGS